MRIVLLGLWLLTTPVAADTITVPSRTVKALIFPSGGQVTHEARLTASKGAHQIVLPDMPPNLALDGLRVLAPDVRLGAVRYRRLVAPPRSDDETADVRDARDRITQIEKQIAWVRDDAKRQKLVAQAAEDRIAFLSALGGNGSLPSDPSALRAIAQMISEETLAARTLILDTDIAARETLEQETLLEEALEKANAALAALVPEPKARPVLVIDVIATDDIEDRPLEIRYFSWDMSWSPVYTATLVDGPAANVTLERSADVVQSTGENWTNTALTLSTQTPEDQISASKLPPDLRRLIDPQAPVMQRLNVLNEGQGSIADPILEAPVIAATQIGQSGLALTYAFSDPVNIASATDAVRIPFDTLSFPATLVARAVPLLDSRAYVEATFTNTGAEPLLPAALSQRYFEDSLVGVDPFPEIASGADVTLGFGPVPGLELERTVLNRSEGDRGIISRSNEKTENTRITIQNLSRRSWPVVLQDRVPYSEQEDLVITYTARPKPETDAADDIRGVLEWRFELSAGELRLFETTSKITWPEGQVVR